MAMAGAPRAAVVEMAGATAVAGPTAAGTAEVATEEEGEGAVAVAVASEAAAVGVAAAKEHSFVSEVCLDPCTATLEHGHQPLRRQAPRRRRRRAVGHGTSARRGPNPGQNTY